MSTQSSVQRRKPLPTIDSALLSKNFVRRAKANDEATIAIFRDLSPNHQPVLLKPTPVPGSLPRECFHNVQKHVEAHGGEIVYGWAL
jgi:hypothetical protein